MTLVVTVILGVCGALVVFAGILLLIARRRPAGNWANDVSDMLRVDQAPPDAGRGRVYRSERPLR